MRKLGGGGEHASEMALGRAQLVQLLGQGHQVGLLSDIQSRLIHGLFHTASDSVLESMTPAARILGVTENATTEELLDFARRFGITSVPVRRSASENSWFGYVPAAEAEITREAISTLVRPLPQIDSTRSKLEAIVALQEKQAELGVVVRNGQIIGLINFHGLTEQMMRPPQAIGPVERSVAGA